MTPSMAVTLNGFCGEMCRPGSIPTVAFYLVTRKNLFSLNQMENIPAYVEKKSISFHG
jgi:hypothetical protein